MTKRSARKLVRQYADQFNSRYSTPGQNLCTAERAYGATQRQLMQAGIDLSLEERMALTAYAHGYVTARTGITEKRQTSELDHERFAEHHAAGAEHGRNA